MKPRSDIKHVLLAPSWYPDQRLPHNGTFFREQAQMLRDAGYKVGVVALDAPLLPLRWDFRLKASEEDGITVIRSKLPQVMWQELPGDAATSRLVSRRALQKYANINGKPDIVHAHSVFPGIYTAASASALWDIPYVITEHRPSSLERPKKSGRWKSLAKAVRQANGRAAVSRIFAAKLTSYYSTDPWDLISLPVPDELSNGKLPVFSPEQPFTFVHVSYWDNNKRVEMTLRAFARARSVNPKIKMVFAGGDKYSLNKMSNLKMDLGIKDCVELLGKVDRSEISSLLSQAHCFVLASAVESAGAVFAEAQMAGLPCIGTLTYGGDYMIEPKTGIQVPVDDEDALAQAMIDMAIDRHEKFRPENIRKRAKERFSEKTFVAASTDFYNSALHNYQAKK